MMTTPANRVEGSVTGWGSTMGLPTPPGGQRRRRLESAQEKDEEPQQSS
jgi:hypothetical protein